MRDIGRAIKCVIDLLALYKLCEFLQFELLFKFIKFVKLFKIKNESKKLDKL